jgi:hypothetical protein
LFLEVFVSSVKQSNHASHTERKQHATTLHFWIPRETHTRLRLRADELDWTIARAAQVCIALGLERLMSCNQEDNDAAVTA